MPPPGVTVAVPFEPPKQDTACVCTAEAVTAEAGWVIVTVADFVQRLASVTTTVYVPAVNPVAVAVV